MRGIAIAAAFCALLCACRTTPDYESVCVTETVMAGDRVWNLMKAQYGTVSELHGTDPACKDARRPIRASMQYE